MAYKGKYAPSKPVLEFVKINDVYQLVDVKTEDFIKKHEAMHEAMALYARLAEEFRKMGY